MDDEMTELHALAVRASQAQLGVGADFVGRVEPGAGFALTGEPVGAFNRLLLGPTPRAQAVLEEACALASARKVPMTAFVAPQVAVGLTEAAAWLGLRPAGTAALMVLKPSHPIRQGTRYDVRKVEDPNGATVSGDLVADAFGLPREAVTRTLGRAWRQGAGALGYVAHLDDAPVASVTVTPHGSTIGISFMATSPDRQRRGAGRALLTRVLGDWRAAGADRFYLFATDAGRRLYDSLGFQVVADYAVWAGD